MEDYNQWAFLNVVKHGRPEIFWRDQHKKRHSASQGGFKTKKEASDWLTIKMLN